MNRFMESIFPKKEVAKEAVSEQASDIQQEPIPLAQEKKPKTLEDISETKNKVGDLETQKKELINKHRDSIGQLKNLGVNEKQADSVKRSETFNDVLNPIENEIKNISEEISNLRQDNDLQQKPKEILRNRIERLNELLYVNIKDFLSTETNKKFLEKLSSNQIEFNPQTEQPTKTGQYFLDKISNNQIELDTIETAKQYSDFIMDHSNRTDGRNILDTIEFKNFKNRDRRIREIMDNIDSRLLDMGTTRG